MERAATPTQLRNWRFSRPHRAHYDATVRARLLTETAQEHAALAELRLAASLGAGQALVRAEERLAPPAEPVAADLRARTFELAEALFQSVHMQLSVPRYRAISVGRGANLDLIDMPLNSAPWLRERFTAIRTLPTEQERLRAIEAIVNWENPGPGGFYDDLGNPMAQPHLVAGTSYEDDPAFLRAPHMAASLGGAPLRISSQTYAESRDEHPLEMHYRGLDPAAHYRLRVVYGIGAMGSRDNPMTLRLVANGRHEIHGMRPKDPAARPMEFGMPAEATRDGQISLTWTRPAGLGGNGRGVQGSEV